MKLPEGRDLIAFQRNEYNLLAVGGDTIYNLHNLVIHVGLT